MQRRRVSDSGRYLGLRVVRALDVLAEHRLTAFHRGWLRAVFEPGVEIGVLSCPRGSAKTWLAAQLAALAIRSGSPLWHPGLEVLAVSGSLEQSRVLLRMVREALADVEADYRWLDSGQRLQVTHKATQTKLRILSSSAKRAMGLEGFSMILADEPGSWEVRGGALMWDALRTALGKRAGLGQRLILIGTRAPADVGTWWPALIDRGSGPGTHVTELRAPDGDAWDSWYTIRRVNPLVMQNANLRRTILRERDEARKSPTMRASFEAYRLNRQVDTSAEVLVTVADWKRVEARPVPPREGRPLLGLDLGAERSWTGAWAVWRNGRCECFALCPGIPDLAERERQDAMPRGLYRRLAQEGSLHVDEGVRVARPETLVALVESRGIHPETCYADRFVLGALRDAVDGRWTIVPRVTRWSEATEDIAGFRRLVADGPLSIAPECRGLARVSMSEAKVESDRQGSVRLRKSRHGRSRDDVAVAGVLATGALVRMLRQVTPRPRWRYRRQVANR